MFIFKWENLGVNEANEKLSAYFRTAKILSQKLSINFFIISKEMDLLYNHHYKNVSDLFAKYIEY